MSEEAATEESSIVQFMRRYHEELLIEGIANEVRWVRNAVGITDTQLAERLGWTERRLARFLEGKGAGSIRDTARIFFAMGCRLKVEAWATTRGDEKGGGDVPGPCEERG